MKEKIILKVKLDNKTMNSIEYNIKKYKLPYSTTKSFYYEFVQSFPSIGTLPYFFYSLSLFRDEMLNGYIWLL